ncbi:hypothetical protein M9458_005798, partial [Cirrhinus mrigala]
IPPGYPYQSITAPFGSHYPYLLQPAAAADADGLAPDVPLPAETSEHLATAADVKPQHLCSPVVVEPLQASREPESLKEGGTVFKKEPNLEDSKDVLSQDSLRLAPITTQDSSAPTEAKAHPRDTAIPSPEEESDQEDEEAVKIEAASSSHPGLYETSRLDSERTTGVETTEPSTGLVDKVYKSSSSSYTDTHHVVCDLQPAHPSSDLSDSLNPLDLRDPVPDAPHLESKLDNPFLPNSSPLHLQPSSAPVAILPEDPMAGMFALVTASELPQAGAVSILADACSSRSELCAGVSPLESTALEGMALLSQMAELEMQRQPREDTQ